MSRSIAIVQSNYIPWKGYFDLINSVDEFVLFDDVQYTRRDWRNRNQLKTPQGLQWLTIPVETKGNYHAKISEIRIAERDWARSHWATLGQNYSRSAYFGAYRETFEALYLGPLPDDLSSVNRRFIEAICAVLGIRTRLTSSASYPLAEGRSERLLSICTAAGATSYLSGPAAKGYLDEALFASQGVEVKWMDYSGYPEYRQLYGKFEHAVTVLDLIFNEGADAPRYMKSFCIHSSAEDGPRKMVGDRHA